MPKRTPQTQCFNVLAVCVVCGVILSVLVAWWSAYSEDTRLMTRVGAIEDPASFPLDDARSRPHADISYFYSSPKQSDGWYYWMLHTGPTVKIMSTAFDATSFNPGEADFINPLPIDQGPTWSIVHTPPTLEQIQSGVDHLEETRGWPMPCAVSIIGTNPFRVSWHIISGIKIGSHSIYPGCPRVLPIKPIWTGLAVDTAVYGVVVLFLIRIFASIRSAIRAKRGLCRGCGYTMHTLNQCPECGLLITTQKKGALSS